MTRKVKVSVLCTVYNHGAFLRKALDSFLNQKTDFDFEIIVHDDASKDDSVEIIKEYEQKYPKIIRPILEKENKYSKGFSFEEIYLPYINGKYIATCEGDDYWTDESKLQSQFDFMESNSDCSICCHNVVVSKNNKIIGRYPASEIKTGYYLQKDSFGFGYVQTSSFFITKDGFVRYISFRNLFKDHSFSGSESYLLFFKSIGVFGFINKDMSVYRLSTPGSWSSRNKTDEKKAKEELRSLKMILSFNKETNYAFAGFLRERIDSKRFNYYYYSHNFKALFRKENRYLLKKKSLSFRFKVFIYRIFRNNSGLHIKD